MMLAFKKIPKHIVVALLIFISIAGFFVFRAHQNVNSPDEAANLNFAKSWRSDARLFVKNAAQQTSSYPLFPRSTAPSGEGVVPTGFVGVPIIFGSISVALGVWSIFYLTIFFTAIAAIGWWYLVKNIFSRSVADISVWLFIFQPAVVYYSVRGLFPNMILVDLLIIAAAAGWYAFENRSRAMMVLSGGALLGAIMVRPPEALFAAALCSVVLYVWGSATVRSAAKKIIGAVLVLAGFVLLARSRNWLPGGYQFLNSSSVFGMLFPFGIHLSRIAHAGYDFVVKLFLPLTLFSVAGMYVAAREMKANKKVVAYSTFFAILSAWLFALYGSWVFSDNLKDPNAVTMGVSYVRYWLPFFVLSLPFVAIALEKISMRLRILCVAALIVFGLWRALFGMEGLLWVTREVVASRKMAEEVLEFVPKNGVIAVRAWDKYFFPERSVLQPFPRDPRTFAAARELLARKTPLFALIETMKEADRLWMRDNGFALAAVQTFGFNTLYEVRLWNEKQ
jgi:hypothetical protein